jgi:chromatin modification-related protein EAF6
MVLICHTSWIQSSHQSLLFPLIPTQRNPMSQSGPPADAKQAQAAALQELEAALKRKRAIDTSLVRVHARSHGQADPRQISKPRSTLSRTATLKSLLNLGGTSSR